MSNTFEILAGLLDRFDNEVEGRELPEPPEAFQTKLREFARGSLPHPQHAEVFGALNQNQEWLGWLAKEVKALRAKPAAQ